MAAALLGAAVVLGAAADLISAAAGRSAPVVVRTDYTTPPCAGDLSRAIKPSHRAGPPGRRSTWHCHRPRAPHSPHPMRPRPEERLQ
ncbi:hypothetical protein [Dactylosporangium matsuzakiense]|uniref:Uncharacterized protein n=2 Tax=Dactylosporangium TaxID=35753 RepID=A0A9W6NTC3_9ACTN|nr:hypothetical protein [Dactylosporangium matsuzakiense]UWZ42432.1 hypothetical protein Dmats_33370 [Dactylosporangium matsuzakiense]GLL08067.1 hypothetical protein GCM10017581_098270 [Dactylosporangium matsuzakiense]